MITGNKSDIAKVLPYVGEGLQKALAYISATDFAHMGGVPPIEKLPKSFAKKFANLFVRFFGSSELLK